MGYVAEYWSVEDVIGFGVNVAGHKLHLGFFGLQYVYACALGHRMKRLTYYAGPRQACPKVDAGDDKAVLNEQQLSLATGCMYKVGRLPLFIFHRLCFYPSYICRTASKFQAPKQTISSTAQ